MLDCRRTSRACGHDGIGRFYLPAFALESLWMEAPQECTGEVCRRLADASRCAFPLEFPFSHSLQPQARRVAMSLAEHNHHIHYIEFVTTEVAAAKRFYTAAFGWEFEDYGPEYASFSRATAGIDGGFMQGAPSAGGPLIVLYATNLEAAEQAVLAAGGAITVPAFAFPGGRRFHFSDGAGNILAVWSE